MKVRWFSIVATAGINAVYLIKIGRERVVFSGMMTLTSSEATTPVYTILEKILNDTRLMASVAEVLNSSTMSRVEQPLKGLANSAAINSLNDQTLFWNTTMPRPWLDASSKKPPAMMMLTNFGWNHPNQTFGIQRFRGLRTLELVEGIVNHEYFHPTAWEDINDGTMEISNETRYYVFLDHEHCGEKNYPNYGRGNMVNRDMAYNRSTEGDWRMLIWKQVQKSKLVQNAKHVKYVLFDCGGNGPTSSYIRVRKSWKEQKKLAFVSVSTTLANAKPWDQGLVPPACQKFHLSSKEEEDIKSCNEASRPVLISFTGHVTRSRTRMDLLALSNNQNVLVGRPGKIRSKMKTKDPILAFERLAKMSAFAAASRGDNLFSYRFSEVMACGAIPVVYADDWMMPFGPELINWTEAAVFIRERDTNLTVDILSNISMEERCRMRQKGLEIYRTYMETGAGTIRGIMETFDLRAQFDI